MIQIKEITVEEQKKQAEFEKFLKELLNKHPDNQTTLDYNSK